MEFRVYCPQSLVAQEAARGATVNHAKRQTYHSGTDRDLLVDLCNTQRLSDKHPRRRLPPRRRSSYSVGWALPPRSISPMRLEIESPICFVAALGPADRDPNPRRVSSRQLLS